jgi:hypothetical protein
MSDIHHQRKISHQQVNYPETVQKLSQIMTLKRTGTSYTDFLSQTQGYASRDIITASSQNIFGDSREFSRQNSANSVRSAHAKERSYEKREMKLSEFQESMKSYLKEEQFMNERKRLWNRELGRKAVANEVSRS